jgi:hypothetical protein
VANRQLESETANPQLPAPMLLLIDHAYRQHDRPDSARPCTYLTQKGPLCVPEAGDVVHERGG